MAPNTSVTRRTIDRVSRMLVISALLASQLIPSAHAQENAAPVTNETIHLQVGDIFEILPVHTIADATYTWILTQDKTFLEASRAPSYRKRLIQPGEYTLYAEIDSPDGTQRITRTITLDYASRQPGAVTSPDASTGSGMLVRTNPPLDPRGNVIMPANSQLLQLSPIDPNIIPLGLDTDLSRDADGDGIPDNDIQGSETFFHSNGTSLYLWITDSPLTTHSLSVTAAAPEGAKTQRITVLSEDIARAQGVTKSPLHIDMQKTGERSYTFNPVFDESNAAGELLYQWQFGDGQQSLTTKATHTYAQDGTYEVSLLVRNLRDGSVVGSTSTVVNVEPESVVASSQSSSQQTSVPAATSSSGFGIGSILLLAFIFLMCLMLGVGIIFLIGRFQKGKPTLADRLETMEQTMVKSPLQETATLKIEPPKPVEAKAEKAVVVETKRQEPPAAIAEREKEAEVERPAPEPVAKAETTPAWLNPAPTTAPKPTPAPTVAPAAQTPKPAPAPVQPPKPTAPAAAPVQAPKPAPAPMPTPKPAAQPSPQSTPPTPAPTPVATTPAWLQTPAAPVNNTPKPAAAQQPTPAPVVTPQMPKPAPTPTLAPQMPKPAPTPTLAPQMPKPFVAEQPAPTSPVAPQVQAPKAPQPVMQPKPAVPPAPMPSMVQPQTPKPPVPAPMPAPQPQVQKPIEAPATPSVPQQPKAVPTPVPAPTPAPIAPVQPAAPVEQKPASAPMDIPRASDDQIAIIRADSLNPPNGQNG